MNGCNVFVLLFFPFISLFSLLFPSLFPSLLLCPLTLKRREDTRENLYRALFFGRPATQFLGELRTKNRSTQETGPLRRPLARGFLFPYSRKGLRKLFPSAGLPPLPIQWLPPLRTNDGNYYLPELFCYLQAQTRVRGEWALFRNDSLYKANCRLGRAGVEERQIRYRMRLKRVC